MRPAPLKWPNNAKIVVSFFVAFEAFDKSSQYRRHEGDKPDYASLAYGEYGGKAGIWRILDALNSNNVKGTIDTNGRVAEIFPDAVKELQSWFHGEYRVLLKGGRELKLSRNYRKNVEDLLP